MNYLENVNTPYDIKKLTDAEMECLADEIRKFLIDSVSKTGGHLASNLGVVEITLALHKVFNFDRDRLIFDVGHQCYVHKILTDRKERMNTLRQYKGISGFPKMGESIYDAFDTGHAGTSISAAYAMAEANRINGNKNFAVAVIGDASLSNGLAFEGLNNAGNSNDRLLVVLNDNEMSISKNVGNLDSYLAKLRTAPAYNRLKDEVKTTLEKIPYVGMGISKTFSAAKRSIKSAIIPGTFFQQMGFTYIGPVDGHDIQLLTKLLERVKMAKKPVFLHIVTKKGKGYGFAEKTPSVYHGIGSFDKSKVQVFRENSGSASYIAGNCILELAEKDEKIRVICAAMTEGCGLYNFRNKFKERFYDVGISEEHGVTFAGALASQGFLPVVAVYSTFLQRSYDNIIHDVALNHLHVIFLVDRAGISGADGETHQGVFDVNFLNTIPGMTVFSPSDKAELREAVRMAVYGVKGPVAVRYPKGILEEGETAGNLYKGKIISNGKRATLVTYSKMTAYLKNKIEDVCHIHLNCISKIDYGTIIDSLKKTKSLIVAEDSIKSGGIGEKIAAELAQRGIGPKIKLFAVDNRFVPQGNFSQLAEELKISIKDIKEYLDEAET